MSCITCKKKWSFVSSLFLLVCIFHYISNWSKNLSFTELLLPIRRVKFSFKIFNSSNDWNSSIQNSLNFLDDFPLHYAALYINRTINYYYRTLLIALHHTHDFWYFYFRSYKNNTHFLDTSNFESANKKPSFFKVAAFFWCNLNIKLSYLKSREYNYYHNIVYSGRIEQNTEIGETICNGFTNQQNLFSHKWFKNTADLDHKLWTCSYG